MLGHSRGSGSPSSHARPATCRTCSPARSPTSGRSGPCCQPSRPRRRRSWRYGRGRPRRVDDGAPRSQPRRRPSARSSSQAGRSRARRPTRSSPTCSTSKGSAGSRPLFPSWPSSSLLPHPRFPVSRASSGARGYASRSRSPRRRLQGRDASSRRCTTDCCRRYPPRGRAACSVPVLACFVSAMPSVSGAASTTSLRRASRSPTTSPPAQRAAPR